MTEPREDGQTIEEMRKDVMPLSSSEEKKRAAGHKIDGAQGEKNSATL